MRRITTKQDNIDLKALAAAKLNLHRCPGGRIIEEGFICLHCGHDTSFGGCNGVTPKIKSNKKGT